MHVPETRYAHSGNVSIAYQVVGDGPFDLVYVPPSVSHVELAWEIPSLAAYFQRLASFSRLIRFDKRGPGMSDRVGSHPSSRDSFFLRGFRARGFPSLPAVPASSLDGKEGVGLADRATRARNHDLLDR